MILKLKGHGNTAPSATISPNLWMALVTSPVHSNFGLSVNSILTNGSEKLDPRGEEGMRWVIMKRQPDLVPKQFQIHKIDN